MEPVDEMVDGRGGVRPHWRGVLGAITALDRTALADRVRRLAEAAEEDGPAPSWRCDPVPLPLTGEEFAGLDAGLTQRARLLDGLLDDLYGPQHVLTRGFLPPAAVFANPAFLRACRVGPAAAACTPTTAPTGRRLHVYAADLVRGPDGQWRVVADRTGGGPGIGYARESRRVLARVMPELFRTAAVRQLRPFFEAWQDALGRTAPPAAAGRTPVVAMLTPGPSDPHWPEHLALSRDLGCALVEARDLTVRAGVLSIKALGGLRRVDVLLRRVPGAAMDPLELDAAPASGAVGGVTGLLDAARSGTVRILNHPGAGLVEAPVFASLLPGLCRQLLNEELLLPTVPTVWLAEPGAARTAAQGRGHGKDRWDVGPAFDGTAPAVPMRALSAEARAAMEGDVARAPWAYVGNRQAPPSRAPCVTDGRLEPLPIALRMFLVHDGTCWRTMPGGLARVLSPGEHVTEALPKGAVLKDVWVFAGEGGTIRGPEPAQAAPMPLRRGGGDLPSRVADDFYWFGRYVERLDAQARLARIGLTRRARGAPLPREVVELSVLQRCLHATGFAPDGSDGPFEDQVKRAAGPRGSIRAGLVHVTRLVEALRDRMTVDTHGAFIHALRAARAEIEPAANAGPDGLAEAMGGLQRLSTTVSGVAAEGMVRGGGRLFLDLGRRIERAAVTAYTLGTVLDQPPARADSTLRLALEVCDSAITYRSRYLSVLQPAPVLDLVLADAGNPRALAFQFAEAAGLLETAGDPDLAAACSAVQGRAGRVVNAVQAASNQPAALPAAAAALIGIGDEAGALSDRITRRFFALLPRLQSVGLETA